MDNKYKVHATLLVILFLLLFSSNSLADEDSKYVEAVREFAAKALQAIRAK